VKPKPTADNDHAADALILGAGASGLMCARTAAHRGKRVLVLDHGPRAARKVLASGGGHCNYTNLMAGPSRYQSDNPHFTRSALARYSPSDALDLLREHNIRYETRQEGQIFLKGSAALIADALMDDSLRAKATVVLGAKVSTVRLSDGSFEVMTSKGAFRAPRLVVAMGGKSWSALGATGTGYQIARQFGHDITELRPGLVPLSLKGKSPFSGISGLAFRATVTASGHEFTGDALVTHRGLSGPAILQASSYWLPGQSIRLDLLPGEDARQWLMEHRDSRMELRTLLAQKLPKRLASAMASHLGGPSPMNSFSDRQLRKFADTLGGLDIYPSGTEGFPKAEVTVGGVDTAKVSSKSMESQLTPGLFFTGEVLDVTGELGGFNLHWAWASGHAAGESV